MSDSMAFVLCFAFILAYPLFLRPRLLAWLDRNEPRVCWVYADRTIFVGMNTGSPGYTDPLVIGERLTLREAKLRARAWVSRHPHGEATVYKSDDGRAPADLRRHDYRLH